MREIKYRRNSFAEIVERIKDIISKDVKGFVKHKHVAEVLNLSPNTIRVYKVKNILPTEHIYEFCIKYDVSFDWLVFDKSFKMKKLRNVNQE